MKEVLDGDVRARESSDELKLAIWGTAHQLSSETPGEAAHIRDVTPKPREVEDKIQEYQLLNQHP
jgi:hypothetical protein